MTWQQLHLQCDQTHVELAEALLMESSALSIILTDAGNQPIYEPMPDESPLWDEVILTALYVADSSTDFEAIANEIAVTTNANRFWLTTVEDKNWEREWMKHYKPIECANNLWIVPKWMTPPEPTAVNVIMDPGLAFGTGYHATTRLCLDWLTEQDLNNKTIIDYGCGSGILGIAALLLGAKQVYSVDIDPQAVLATRQNAERNSVDDRLRVFLPDDFQQYCIDNSLLPADAITANILAKPLMSLSSYFGTLLKPQGNIVLSGLIEPQIDEVITNFTDNGFDINDKYTFVHQDECHWIRLSGLYIG